MANKKELILRSGFTYRELLAMKNNFYAMGRWYRLERKSIPESEPKDFIKHILTTAASASSSTLIISIISLAQAIFLITENHDIKSPIAAFVIYLMMFIILIYHQKNDLNLKAITIVKLIILHYRVKMGIWINNPPLKW